MNTNYKLSNYFTPKIFCLVLLFTSLFSVRAYAQETNIIEKFEEYHAAPRELAYVHLNKSVYVEGEMLGFKAYVVDKSTKELSPNTSNLYCTISDKDGNVLKKKLVHVNNGVAHNIFNIDSTLSTGTYTFKAYTNWMRNFKEANHYQQTFKVFDADNNNKIEALKATSLDIDLQLLGEGGHIVYDIPNTVGVIAKNELGYGIPFATGRIVDNNGLIVSNFKLNEVGLAKTVFTPTADTSYTVELDFNEEIISVPINDIKAVGFNLQLTEVNGRVLLEFRTNETSSAILKEKYFKLALHNDSEIKIADFVFNDENKVVIAYPIEELYSGINIFTVFNENNQPVLERLFFNHNGIKRAKVLDSKIETEFDSLSVNLRLQNKPLNEMSSLSISILPEGTASYNHHNNIISQTHIQPYIKGLIEKGSMYFSKVDRTAKYNLDLLMVTQGWSSYDWNDIFNYEDVFSFPFERGIDVVANVNTKKGKGNYIVYPLENSKTQVFELSDSDKTFTAKSLVPTEDDLFRIGFLELDKNNFKKKPSLYLQYYPSKFAEYNIDYPIIFEENLRNDNTISIPENSLESWKSAETLDEVVITTNVTESRAESLAGKAVNSRVDIIKDHENRPGLRVDLYLQRLGWSTQFDYFSGTLSIINPRVTWKDPVPLVYLDDALLNAGVGQQDFSLLTFLTMDVIDYIEYELYGMGGGLRGSSGFIKIYTKPNSVPFNKSNNVVTYDVPLRFSNEKKFYTPKYQFYNTDFFREYGTIDWKANLIPDQNGGVSFNVPNTKTNTINLYVEGIVSGGEYVSEVITLSSED